MIFGAHLVAGIAIQKFATGKNRYSGWYIWIPLSLFVHASLDRWNRSAAGDLPYSLMAQGNFTPDVWGVLLGLCQLVAIGVFLWKFRPYWLGAIVGFLPDIDHITEFFGLGTTYTEIAFFNHWGGFWFHYLLYPQWLRGDLGVFGHLGFIVAVIWMMREKD